MYHILDLRENPPIIIPDITFETEQECIEWIDNNGDATIYTIEKIN
jgi:hypothetical protein